MNLENINPKCCIFASFGISWTHIDNCFSPKSHSKKILFSPIIKSFVFSYKLQTLIHTSFKSARGENQSVSEFFLDTYSESRQFQFDRECLSLQ